MSPRTAKRSVRPAPVADFPTLMNNPMQTNIRSLMTRRNALKTGLAAAGSGTFLSTLQITASESPPASPVILKEGATVLFQGDSITDAGRNRGAKAPNDVNALGRGYPFLLASHLLMIRPELGLKIHNRGISGNKVPDLDARWQADCIDLKPDVLSILIGVNDIWHMLNGRYKGTVDSYAKGFTALLEKTKAALPETRIVICQPFVLRCGAVNAKWFPEFDERKAAAKSVAEGAGAIWVPFQNAFDASVAKGTKPEYWAADGVHPTMAGHMLMAKVWSEATGLR